jgi:hypothetical protein
LGIPKNRVNPLGRWYKIGRSAITGRFMPVKTAQQKPQTAVVETIKTSTKKGK